MVHRVAPAAHALSRSIADAKNTAASLLRPSWRYGKRDERCPVCAPGVDCAASAGQDFVAQMTVRSMAFIVYYLPLPIGNRLSVSNYRHFFPPTSSPRSSRIAQRKRHDLHETVFLGYIAPAFCAYSQEAFDSGTVRFADSVAFALAAVPSRMRPAIPCVMQASRNRL